MSDVSESSKAETQKRITPLEGVFNVSAMKERFIKERFNLLFKDGVSMGDMKRRLEDAKTQLNKIKNSK